ncbi:hypothetical protein J7M23_01250 [Candidatus Sumerlaeota bacterium]|nr:hypothetical protein [Candidatus Sumerlaeota bacterium]
MRTPSAIAERLAQTIGKMPPRLEYFIPTVTLELDAELEALFWFVITGICYQTHRLKGKIGNRELHGSDYMIGSALRTLQEAQNFWQPEHLLTLNPDELRSMFSDDGISAHSTLDRVEERLELIRDMMHLLKEKYNSRVMNIYNFAEGKVAGKSGVLSRLAEFKAYSDPTQKKSNLLVLYLNKRGIWRVADPESIQPPVDYHVMRVALRLGLVSIDDPCLNEKLRARRPVSAEEDATIRQHIQSALMNLVTKHRVDLFNLDSALWMVGRNCCLKDTPVCQYEQCTRAGVCTLVDALNYTCKLRCPFADYCSGAMDDEFRSLTETNFSSIYY